jgi:hypothetical protein
LLYVPQSKAAGWAANGAEKTQAARPMSIENFMMAVAFAVILGTAGYYLRRAIRLLRRLKG